MILFALMVSSPSCGFDCVFWPALLLSAGYPVPKQLFVHGYLTIDQQKIYGDYVNFYHEVALPEVSEPMLRYLRQTVAHALMRTLVRSASGTVSLCTAFFTSTISPRKRNAGGFHRLPAPH